jgi:hypothetical protein
MKDWHNRIGDMLAYVGKGKVTEREFAFLVGRLALQLRRPEDKKDGLSMKKEGVRSVRSNSGGSRVKVSSPEYSSFFARLLRVRAAQRLVPAEQV